MLNLDKRPCTIGSSINTRTEKHGDEDVPAMDIPLAGVHLTAGELCKLLGESLAHEALFNKRADGLAEPLFTSLHPLRIKDKFEDCTVCIEVGLKAELITLESVTLARLTLDPQVGGLTALSLQVQCTPDLDDGIATLLRYLNHSASVEIDFGDRAKTAKKAQPELPLNGFGEGEQPEKKAPKRRGRPPQVRDADLLN